MRYAPTLTDEKEASKKHLFAPVGSFGGRMRYAPTGDIKKGPSHCPAPAPVGSFCGAYSIRPYPDTSKKGLPRNIYSPLSGRLEGVCDTPLQGHQKTEIQQQKSRVRAGRIQLRTRRFSLFVFSGQLLQRCARSNSPGLQMYRQRMLAIEIISANTPAAVTSAPAP